MNVLALDAGETWVIPLDRVVRITDDEGLHDFSLPVPGLEGLLPAADGLIAVWMPQEFTRSGRVVILLRGGTEELGLRVSLVLGVQKTAAAGAAHGEPVVLEDGRHGRWFDTDVLERRLAGMLPEE